MFQLNSSRKKTQLVNLDYPIRIIMEKFSKTQNLQSIRNNVFKSSFTGVCSEFESLFLRSANEKHKTE